jgi:hypothetical protein
VQWARQQRGRTDAPHGDRTHTKAGRSDGSVPPVRVCRALVSQWRPLRPSASERDVSSWGWPWTTTQTQTQTQTTRETTDRQEARSQCSSRTGAGHRPRCRHRRLTAGCRRRFANHSKNFRRNAPILVARVCTCSTQFFCVACVSRGRSLSARSVVPPPPASSFRRASARVSPLSSRSSPHARCRVVA